MSVKQFRVEFSRSLLERNVPAWQRLQAVRAVEAYRDSSVNGERKEPSHDPLAIKRVGFAPTYQLQLNLPG
jgi:hypothetical protein